MAIELRSCGKCGFAIEQGMAGGNQIGKPYIQCPSCYEYNIVGYSDEWDLKGSLGKVWHIVRLFLSLLIYSFGGPFLVFLASKIVEFDLTDELMFGSWITTFIVWGFFVIRSLIFDIRESRKRLKDQKYLEILDQLGLLYDGAVKLVD